MLNFVTENKTVWELLQETTKPLVLYGMGNGADKILEQLEARGKAVAGIFASDEFVRGQQFHGLTVSKYSDLLAQFGDFVIVVAFASQLPEVLERFYSLAASHETYAPHVPLFPGEEIVTREWLHRYEPQLQRVYDSLADDQSRQVFAGTLNYKLSGKISYLQQITTDRCRDLQQLFTWQENEVYADLGAYNGDTLLELLTLTDNRYRAMVAVEPDPKNYKKLCVAAQQLAKAGAEPATGAGPEPGLEPEQPAIAAASPAEPKGEEEFKVGAITCVPKGIWNKAATLEFVASGGRQATLETAGATKRLISLRVDSLDNIMAKVGVGPATYIKMDVEGVEQQALEGAKAQLATLPKLMIAAYHHDEDLFRLPLLLWQLQPGYKIYLRKHPYVPAWELNFFAKA